jgi:hypothetical protein
MIAGDPLAERPYQGMIPVVDRKAAMVPADPASPLKAHDFPWPKIVLWTLLFQFAWSWRSVPPLLSEGAMRDTDDLMRLSQVRSFLDGQGWYDLVNHRMDPPVGADIHWSRLVDLPLALLTLFFDLFTSPVMAERLAALVWPSFLIVAAVLVLVAIARRLEPSVNPLLVVLLSVLCVHAQLEFSPGRIDHHGLQILLFYAALLFVIADDIRLGRFLAGVAIAASISVGLDAIVLIALVFCWLVLEFVRGRDDGRGLIQVAGGIAMAAPLLFILNFPPQKWLIAACDANSAFYFSALMLVAAVYASLWFLAPRISTGPRLPLGIDPGRLSAATLFGLLALGGLFAVNPGCLAGPYGTLDPQLVERWLVNVGEASSLRDHLAKDPGFWLSGIGYLSMALLAAVAITRRDIGRFPQSALLLAVLLVTIALAFFQIRAIRIGIFVTVPFCAAFATIAIRWIGERLAVAKAARAVFQVAVVALLAAPTWMVLGIVSFPDAPRAAISEDVAAAAGKTWREGEPGGLCNRESEFAILAGLERGLVMHDVDTGPGLVVFTGHDGIGGPYHRNGKAILEMLDFFETDEAHARAVSAARGIDYVAYCERLEPYSAEELASSTLAARLVTGREPAWLERVSPASERLHVFRVRRD